MREDDAGEIIKKFLGQQNWTARGPFGLRTRFTIQRTKTDFPEDYGSEDQRAPGKGH
jgi:hypothetical protein